MSKVSHRKQIHLPVNWSTLVVRDSILVQLSVNSYNLYCFIFPSLDDVSCLLLTVPHVTVPPLEGSRSYRFQPGVMGSMYMYYTPDTKLKLTNDTGILDKNIM